MEYVTGKKPGENDSKYLTKFQTNRTVKCNDAYEENGVKWLLKDEQEWRLISYIGWTGISDECKLTVSRILHLLPFLPQPTESIWFPTIWSNTSPGKSNKYLYLSVHHLASLISTFLYKLISVFYQPFSVRHYGLRIRICEMLLLSHWTYTEWKFMSTLHFAENKHKKLFSFFQRIENYNHSGRFAVYKCIKSTVYVPTISFFSCDTK